MELLYAIAIIIAYIIGCVVVGFIQKRQINSLKSQLDGLSKHISVMESQVKVFDPDKVNEYVKMLEKTAQHQAADALRDQPKMQEMLEKAFEKHTATLKDVYMEQMGKEHRELFDFVLNTAIQNKDNTDGLKMLFDMIPDVKHKIIEVAKDFYRVDLPTL